MWDDVRYALRVIRTNRVTTVIALLTLAIGVGANTAIFSIVRSVLLNPVPYADADRVVRVSETWPDRTGPRPVSKRNYLDWLAQNAVFERMVAESWGAATVSSGPVPLFAEGSRVSPSYFDLFGVRAAMGRAFVDGEDQPGRDHVVILSHHFWTVQLGADPTILGRSLRIDGELYTVIGVMPAHLHFTFWDTELWRPLSFDPLPLRNTRDLRWAVAKLKRGVSVSTARTEMRVIGERLAREYPDSNRGYGIFVEAYPRPLGLDVEASLYLLLGAVGAVLLIGCLNLANLALARGAAHRRELAIRAALGAGRLRLVRQIVTEHLIVAMAGGLLGIVLGTAVLRLMTPFIPTTGVRAAFPADTMIRVDWTVWVFAVGLSVVSGISFGLMPAFAATRLALTDALTGAGTTNATGDRGSHRLRQLLVVGDLALAFVLLTGATLLIRSFFTLTHRIAAGYDSTNVVTASLPIPDTRFASGVALNAYLDQVAARVQALRGIREVGFADAVPTQGFPFGKPFQIVGQSAVAYSSRPICGFKVVSPSYFQAVRLHVLEGRALEEQDRENAPLVVVINLTMAHAYFGGGNPVGQRLLMRRYAITGSDAVPDLVWTIVGIVADEGVGPFEQRTADPALYVTREQYPRLNLSLVVRTMGDPTLMQESIRKTIAAFNPDQAVTNLRTLDQLKADDVASDRLRSALFAAFAGMAVVLAAVGLYGVMWYTVVQRTREIGIRAALGAGATRLVGLILHEGAALIAVGLAVGFGVARVVTRLLGAFLFGVAPSDPWTWVGAAAVLAAVGLVACYVPARRATAVDPLIALKLE